MSIVQEMYSRTNKSPVSDYSTILGRTTIQSEITEMLNSFEDRCSDNSFKKGLYIYGPPGAGKTHFVVNLLKEIGYDVITITGAYRNKAGRLDTYPCEKLGVLI